MTSTLSNRTPRTALALMLVLGFASICWADSPRGIADRTRPSLTLRPVVVNGGLVYGGGAQVDLVPGVAVVRAQLRLRDVLDLIHGPALSGLQSRLDAVLSSLRNGRRQTSRPAMPVLSEPAMDFSAVSAVEGVLYDGTNPMLTLPRGNAAFSSLMTAVRLRQLRGLRDGGNATLPRGTRPPRAVR